MKNWLKQNEEDYAKAVKILANKVVENFDKCDSEDDKENWVKDNWENELPNDLVDAIYKKVDVANIIHKNYLMGGGWEVLRRLEIDVVEKANEIYG